MYMKYIVYKNCGNEIKWRMIYPVVTAIYAITQEAWKKFNTSMRFESVTSRYRDTTSVAS